jgi:Tfp pilus assembly protein PilW
MKIVTRFTFESVTETKKALAIECVFVDDVRAKKSVFVDCLFYGSVEAHGCTFIGCNFEAHNVISSATNRFVDCERKL